LLAGRGRAAGQRRDESNAILERRIVESRHEVLAADAHGSGLEPSAGLARRDDDDLELASYAHPRDKRLARRLGGDVLILDVNEAFGAADCGDSGTLDFANLFVALFERGDRAHDA